MAAPPPPWQAILLVGPTGSGKTPLGDEIERRGFRGWRCVHFDFGAVLRALAAAPEGEGGLSPGEQAVVRASLATGALFEERDLPMIAGILRRFAERRIEAPGDRLVLNGLPRHRGQAEALPTLATVEIVVSLEAASEVVRERLRLDPGKDRAGRPDDDPESVRRRLGTFRERTGPLLGFYAERGVPIISVDVGPETTAGEMYETLSRRAAG